MLKSGRRAFLKTGVFSAASLGTLASAEEPVLLAKGEMAAPPNSAPSPPPFKLGLVTYNLAKDWDIDTIIKNCEETGFEGVELRTTHKHGVEISLDKAQRAEVKQRFAASRVRLMSLGTTCEYESPDPAVVEKNIEETRRWCELAQDLGCVGVKVRPNGFPKDVPEDKTLDQIGHALARCGDIARDHGVEIWLEVHGPGTHASAQHSPNSQRGESPRRGGVLEFQRHRRGGRLRESVIRPAKTLDSELPHQRAVPDALALGQRNPDAGDEPAGLPAMAEALSLARTLHLVAQHRV